MKDRDRVQHSIMSFTDYPTPWKIEYGLQHVRSKTITDAEGTWVLSSHKVGLMKLLVMIANHYNDSCTCRSDN